MGVWSLVVGQLVLGPITFAIAHYYEPWRVERQFSLTAFKDLISYGAHISAGNIVNFAATNLDTLVIGRQLGAQVLGIYSMAFRVVRTPLQLISKIVPHALFPVFSEIQDDDQSLVRGYLRSTHYVVLLTFPLFAGCMVLASEIVTVIFGEKWVAAIPLVQVLCFAIATRSAGMNIVIVFNAKGRPDVSWKWNLFILLVYLPSFYFASRWGALGIALAIAILSLPFLLLWQFWLTKIVNMPWRDYWNSLKHPLIGSLMMAIIIWNIKEFWFPEDIAPLATLLVLTSLGVCIYCGVIFLFDRLTVFEIISLLKRQTSGDKRSTEAMEN